LAAFAKAQARLQEEGISVVAASTDPLEKARETVAEHSLPFPVGYGLPLRETAATLGPIGRLVWQDVVGLVQFYKKKAGG
jgi:AhpC/TSA family